MYLLIRWILFSLAVMLVAWIIPGISVNGFLNALAVGLVLGLINAFIRPVVMFIAIPVNILTMGLFTLVINAFMLKLAAYITPGFSVDGFLNALWGSLILAILGILINKIDRNDK